MSASDPSSEAVIPPRDGLDEQIGQAFRSFLPRPDLFGRIIAAAANEGLTAESKSKWFADFVGRTTATEDVVAEPITAEFEDFRIGVATITTPHLAAAQLPLDLRSGELAELQHWLESARVPGPSGDLRSRMGFGPIGCKAFHWQGQRFSVVCFYDSQRRGIHLFTISGRELSEPPPAVEPEFETIGGLPTASWSQGDNTHVLVAGLPGLDLRRMFTGA